MKAFITALTGSLIYLLATANMEAVNVNVPVGGNIQTAINTYSTKAPPVNDTTVFFNVSKATCYLNVPAGSLNAYLSAAGWAAFSHVQDNLVVTDLPKKSSRPEVLYLQACQQVRFSNIDEEQRVSIFNSLGKLVRTGKAVELEHQSLSNLPTGMYFLLLHDGNSSRTFKIVL